MKSSPPPPRYAYYPSKWIKLIGFINTVIFVVFLTMGIHLSTDDRLPTVSKIILISPWLTFLFIATLIFYSVMIMLYITELSRYLMYQRIQFIMIVLASLIHVLAMYVLLVLPVDTFYDEHNSTTIVTFAFATFTVFATTWYHDSFLFVLEQAVVLMVISTSAILFYQRDLVVAEYFLVAALLLDKPLKAIVMDRDTEEMKMEVFVF